MSVDINDILKMQDPDAVRALVREALAEDKISNAEGARRAGMAESTFAAWLSGKYQGNNEKATGDAMRWLVARQSQRMAAASITASPDFIETPSARDFITALRYAQVACDITVIVGAPGIGKTMAAEAYKLVTPNVWLTTMTPSTSKPSAMLAEICAELDVPEKSTTKMARALGRFVKGKKGLLIVDEGQNLRPESMDELRALNDIYKVAIAVIGNEKVVSRLEGKQADYGQLYSRVGTRLIRPRPNEGDISALIAAWGVTDPQEVTFLMGVAGKAGALRTLDKTMRLASMLANGANEPRGLRHLKAARARSGATEA
ncbi:AAA family ATPase [Nitrospirillum amazonense]|uniref:AAA family ATPase n=1 Tax=Nitrospirillum amazonense TaxID=28077 RepID=UPI002412252E|nr:AAA family ATPase [Nitrospirillum amazonense]MDG3444505.1 AAA family ATPase [Nitrospirillum amazonense]